MEIENTKRQTIKSRNRKLNSNNSFQKESDKDEEIFDVSKIFQMSDEDFVKF